MPYTIRQAAAERRCSDATIRRAIERGDLPADYTIDLHGQRVAQIAESKPRGPHMQPTTAGANASRTLLDSVRAEIAAATHLPLNTRSRTGQSTTTSYQTDSFNITPETSGFRVSVYRDAHPEMFAMTNRATVSGCVRWALVRIGIVTEAE